VNGLESLLLGVPGIVAGIGFHEYAHALVADLLGDDTPRRAGRVTPEPWVHLDLLGTFLILFYGFGWGKPVPVNPRNLRNPRTSMMLVSLAGPAANLLLTFIFGLIYGLVRVLGFSQIAASIVDEAVYLNAGLAVLNLIPVPPLDGSKILAGLFPDSVGRAYLNVGVFAPLFLALLLTTDVAGRILGRMTTLVVLYAGMPGSSLGSAIAGLFGSRGF
jgi:Zn-dependent protease